MKYNINKQINLLLNFWAFRYKYKELKTIKAFKFIFKSNSVRLMQHERSLSNLYIYEEFYTPDAKKFLKIIKNLNPYFEIIEQKRYELLIYFDERLFKIYFNKRFIPKNIKSIKKFYIFFHKIKSIYHSNFLLNYLQSKINSIIYPYSSTMDYNTFLKLNFNKNFFDQNVRNDNLKIVTNNFKNINVYDIIKYYKKKNNIKKSLNKSYFKKKEYLKSFKSQIPTHINLNYWRSSNYLYFKNILHGFIRGHKNYEEKKLTIPNFFKKKKNFRIVNKNLIKNILNSNSIVVINNRVYSGRNRIMALIGNHLNGEPYHDFKYKKFFDIDNDKKKLIEIIYDIYSIYKYKKIKILNLDSNYLNVFSKRNKDIVYTQIGQSFLNKKQIILSKNKKINIFEAKNLFNPLSITLFLFSNRKKNFDCYYLDINKNFHKYEHNNIIHLFKIIISLLTGLNLLLIAK